MRGIVEPGRLATVTAMRIRPERRTQRLDHLSDRMCEFIARQQVVFLACVGGPGGGTFRAGPPGFVKVLDRRHLIWPEPSKLPDPYVSLLFVDLFRDVVSLRIHGWAEIVEPGAVRVRVADAELRCATPPRGTAGP